MNTEAIEALFEKYDDEYLKFDRVKNKTSNRSDLHAFNLLDKLIPDTSDIVSAAEHDEIFLDTALNELSEVITEDQIIELIRCGVRYRTDYECLAMFV